jgi:hypothetical protein
VISDKTIRHQHRRMPSEIAATLRAAASLPVVTSRTASLIQARMPQAAEMPVGIRCGPQLSSKM